MTGTGSQGESGSSPGLLASLRGLAATAVGIAQTRLQLVSNELEEQGIRGLQILALGAAYPSAWKESAG